MKFCPECGVQLVSQNFCHECGANISKYLGGEPVNNNTQTDSFNFGSLQVDAQKEYYKEVGFEVENGVLVKYTGKSRTVVIPRGITEIYDEAFKGNEALTSVVVGEDVRIIGKAAFMHCFHLKEVTLPDSVEEIYELAFLACYNLEKIFIGNSIENIGSTAFQGCSKIHEIVCFPKNPPVSDAWFPETVRQTATLYVPEESICLYQVADEWKYFSNIKGFSSSAIKEILLDEENEVNVIEIARYDISGRLLSAPVKGINFVKMSDGSMKKVIVK